MKFLVLALVTHAAVGGGSLGVGLDVLPPAYTFAASRFDFAPDLRLTSCDKTSCRWAVGHGVELVAYLSESPLDVGRLEVSTSSIDRPWFEKACLTVVALTLSGADRSDVRAIADTITHPVDRFAAAPEANVDGIRFYGQAGGGGALWRCGAVFRSE